jgi:predicted O-linked N-acetylglucosamine transferase (SPINDLY family)
MDWTPIYGKSDFDAASLIHQKGIHILVDLAGHTANNRLPVFSYKPAPVQVSWLGYFSTTGLPEMDYFLGDPHLSPPSENIFFTENLWNLPETWLCQTPPAFELPVSDLPALSNGYITFASFANLSKINDKVVSTWASVLHQAPKSKLLIKSKQLADTTQINRLQNRFKKFDITPDRLLLEAPETWNNYFKAYNRVDIILDTFPYPGGTTSVDALWMGVPILTLRGDRFLSRLGESIAINAGNQEWIAEDVQEYVKKAVDYSSELQRLAQQRGTLRSRILKSPLFDANRFAKSFGDELLGMWLQSSKLIHHS